VNRPVSAADRSASLPAVRIQPIARSASTCPRRSPFPTAAAIDGLEAALAGLGLLDDALAVDLRRPQDYFQRIWSTGFRAAGLARAADDADAVPGLEETA
jgi:hypothetical protein